MISADALRANLAVAKVAVLEAELALSQREVATLKQANKDLKAELVSSRREVATLKRANAGEDGRKEAKRPKPRSGEEYMQRLQGAWQSLSMGYIEVYYAEDMGLRVKIAGEEGAIIGRLFASAEHGGSRTRISLERSFSWCDKTEVYHINAAASTKDRVVWDETMPVLDRSSSSSGPRCDVWNKSLIPMFHAAAKFVEELDLRSDCRAGLSKLAKDEVTHSEHTVALCTATKNRLWQLRHALPLNLLHCWPHRNWVRIHVVDCDSTDGTLDWILTECRAAIDIGLLKVYSTEGRMPFWHASVAKNTAHIVALQDILVNVDADNLVGGDFVLHVVEQFRKRYTVLQYEDGDGTCGRIACWRRQFSKIHGYDEDAYPVVVNSWVADRPKRRRLFRPQTKGQNPKSSFD